MPHPDLVFHHDAHYNKSFTCLNPQCTKPQVARLSTDKQESGKCNACLRALLRSCGVNRAPPTDRHRLFKCVTCHETKLKVQFADPRLFDGNPDAFGTCKKCRGKMRKLSKPQ